MNILITGTSKGIGRYLAIHYLTDWHDVYGLSRSSATNMVCKNTTSEKELYHHHLIDITNEKDVSYAIKTFPSMDVVINNAGIASMNSILTIPIETVRKIMDTNYVGTYLVSREAVKRMKPGGRIINISSVAVPLELEGEAAYVASKAAIEILTRLQAKEFAPMGITSNCIGLPPMDTDLIKGVSDEKIQAVIDKLVIKRKCTIQDITNVIDFLIRPESNFITGQIVYLGGCR